MQMIFVWCILEQSHHPYIFNLNLCSTQPVKTHCVTIHCEERCAVQQLKGIVHPKMKILLSFTHPQVVPNLHECHCSAEHKGRYSE